MAQQANGTLDMSEHVQKHLGMLTWEILVLRAQVQELQQRLALAIAHQSPQPEGPESSPEYMPTPTNHQQQDEQPVA